MKDDSIYLLHIRDALNRIFDYTAGGEENFLQDTKTQDAVVRNLEIIGEAVKHVSENFRAQNVDVPWKRIAGMRDKMIH
ncbi:MAG TPA: HepT-like ribonuclease domain-containing protein [Terriglobia bacterium]|nr:HepT-like ribonuclease domain-containing protein [Terriglobia bacterium]